MIDGLIAALLLVGAAFMLIAAIGLARLPDVYTRMSATSKAATLGAACMLLASAVRFVEAGVSGRAMAAIAFVMLSAPVAAHMIGRAAYTTGVPLWKGTLRDEMKQGGAAPTNGATPEASGGGPSPP